MKSWPARKPINQLFYFTYGSRERFPQNISMVRATVTDRIWIAPNSTVRSTPNASLMAIYLAAYDDKMWYKDGLIWGTPQES